MGPLTQSEIKNFGRDERTREIAASILLISLGLFGFYLVQIGIVQRLGLINFNHFRGRAVANLAPIKGTVRSQSQMDGFWIDRQNADSVYYGDSVFTGADGIATLSFNDGRTLRLLPNSLVVLSYERPNEPFLNLSQAFHWLGAVPPAPTVELKRGAIDVLSAGEGAGRLKVGHERVPFSAVKEHGQISRLGRDFGRVVLDFKSRRPGFGATVEAPVYAGIQDLGTQVSFNWESTNLAASRETVEIRSSEDFSMTVSPQDGQYTVRLPKGNYLWRIVRAAAPGAPEQDSAWIPFTVKTFELPSVAHPAPGTVITATDPRKNSVRFEWHGEPSASYRIELTENLPEGASPTQAVVRGNHWDAELQPGNYSWTVRPLQDGTERASSAHFRIVYDTPASTSSPTGPAVEKTPLRIAARDGLVSTEYSLRKADATLLVRLGWTRVEAAEKYTLRFFSRDNRPTGSAFSKNPSYALKTTLSNEKYHHYQVSAKLANGEVVHSKTALVMGSFARPRQQFSRRLSSSSQVGNVVLTWERNLLAIAYEIQVGIDPNLNGRTVVLRSNANFKSIHTKPGHKYYWRVRSIYKTSASKWTEIFSVPDP